MPGRQVFGVREATMQHGVRLTRGRRHFPERYVNLGVGLVAFGPARLAHLLHGGRLQGERQSCGHFLVFPAPLLPGHHVPIDDLQITADLLVDVKEHLPGNRLVLEIMPGDGHLMGSSSVMVLPDRMRQPTGAAAMPAR